MEDALGKVDGVKKLSELPTDDRAHAYELVSEQEVDLRPEVFRMIVEKGWVLLELHRDAQTLEDVFRSLTIGDERRNRKLAASGDDPDEEVDDEEDDSGEHADVARHEERAAKAQRS